MPNDDDYSEELIHQIREEIAEQRRRTAEAAGELEDRDADVYDFFDGPWGRPHAVDADINNGAGREINGRFAMLPERRFHADGRDNVSYDEFYAFVRRIAFLDKRARGMDIVQVLMAVKAMRKHVDLVEHEAVAIARNAGWSWQSIAEVLGVHRSAVHKRYAQASVGKRVKRRRDDAR